MNLEAQVALDNHDAVVFHEGSLTRFPRPANFALDETNSSPAHFPNNAFVTKARDASNVGFYFAKVGTLPCPGGEACQPQPALAPRMALPDGSRVVFDTLDGSGHARLAAYEDRYGNRQATLFDVAANGATLPFSLLAGPRSIQFLYQFGPTSTQVDVTAQIANPAAAGPPNIFPRARLVIQQGYLTDVCATDSSSPARVCPNTRPSPDPNPNAADLGCSPTERTLWHFSYVQPGTSPLKRLDNVMDETCAIVETHTYGILANGTIVASSSQTARESLRLFNNPQFDSKSALLSYDMQRTLGRSALPSLGPVEHIDLNPAIARMKGTGDACVCGPSLNRTWGTGVTGTPRVLQIKTGTTFPSTTSYSRMPGGIDDPFGFELPVNESQTDATAFNSAPKFFRYRYLHPTIRQPTETIGPGPALGVPLITVDDYDNDDPNNPCVVGRVVNSGNPDLANESPTPFLCRALQFDMDQTVVRLTRFQYDDAGRLVKRVGPAGDVTTYDYYSGNDTNIFRAGMLQSVRQEDGTHYLETTYDNYEYMGHARSVIDPNQEPTLRTYDARGRLTKVSSQCLPNGDCSVNTITSWEADGKPAGIVLPRGGSMRYIYGTSSTDFGRLKQLEQHGPLPASSLLYVRTFDYDVAGNVLLQQDFTSPSNTPSRAITKDYNYFHAPITHTTSTGTRKLEYQDGLLQKQTDYDSFGPIVNSVTTWSYDGFRRMRRMEGPEAVTNGFEYAPNDDIDSISDGNGNRTIYEHDVFHDLVAVSSPDSGHANYTYTVDGLLQTMADADAADRELERLEFRYDGFRRLHEEVRTFCPGGGACSTRSDATLVTNTWDAGAHALGRLSSVMDAGSGQTDYAYDTRGRLESETHHPMSAAGSTAFSLQLKYGYDSGLLATMQYPPQVLGGPAQVVTLTLGDDDEIRAVDLGSPTNPNVDNLADSVTHYPFGGGLRHYRRGNDLATDIVQDADGRVKAVSGPPVTLNYVLNARGLPQSLAESGDSTRSHYYAYDGQMRLLDASDSLLDESFTYDPAGNRTSKIRNSYEHFYSFFDAPVTGAWPPNNLLRRVTGASATGEWAYGYDPAGNATSVDWLGPPRQQQFILDAGPHPNLQVRTDNATCLTYDARRDLVSVGWASTTVPIVATAKPRSLCVTAGAQIDAINEYRYDSEHRRVYRKDASGQETHFIYGRSGELLAEASAAGNVERAWVYLDGQPLALILRDGGYGAPPPRRFANWIVVICIVLVIAGLSLTFLLTRRSAARAMLALLLLGLATVCGTSDSRLPTDPVLYFHNDRLGMPLRLTSGTGAGAPGRTVWSAQHRAFGDFQSVNTDPDGDGVRTDQPARFPGQFDERFFKASPASLSIDGPYYNHHRWYDPSTSRYLQPEAILRQPRVIGLEAMEARTSPTYSYARSNPAVYMDPTGLLPPIGPLLPCYPWDTTVVCCLKQNPGQYERCGADPSDPIVRCFFTEAGRYEICIAAGTDPNICLVGYRVGLADCFRRAPYQCR